MEVAGGFFGGMEINRHNMMEKRPHWCMQFSPKEVSRIADSVEVLEMLGVHEDYQKLGIGSSLIQWGTEQADRDCLETYLDGSEMGQPVYIKHHGFTPPGTYIPIPARYVGNRIIVTVRGG